MDIQKIVNALLGAGLTQAEIAKSAECSQPTISDIARGRVGRVRPSYRIVVGISKLAAEHGVDAEGNLSPETREQKC